MSSRVLGRAATRRPPERTAAEVEAFPGAADAMHPGVIPRAPPSLSRSLLLVLGGLVIVSTVATTGLVWVTAALHQSTAELRIGDARMRASLRTKVALLWFARESDAAAVSPTAGALLEQARAEVELEQAAEETRRLAMPERAQQLDSLLRKTQEYVALREGLQRQGLALDVILSRASPALEAVFADLKDLVTSDELWTRDVEHRARRLGKIADVVFALALATLLAGFLAAAVGSRKWLEVPILRLSDAIAQFAGGDEARRALPEGVREVRQIATNFNVLADRLARQEKERLAFLAAVAHDLRNPLSPITLAIWKLQAGGGNPTPESCARLFGIVQRQVARLDRMIGDLLDATRIESGQLELRPSRMDLREVARAVVDLFGPTSRDHELVVDLPSCPVVVYADPVRVEQVLINLVSNAIKYSPGGGRVKITVQSTPAAASVAVSDEGIGIPPEEQARIFDWFHRTDRSRNLAPGVGLGLSVARAIAQAHGGRLEVASTGHGSTFRLTLPVPEELSGQ